jgi:hypothetical protein
VITADEFGLIVVGYFEIATVEKIELITKN